MSARILLLTCAVALIGINPSFAQQYHRPNAPQAAPFSKKGSVEGVSNNGLVISAGNQKYMVGITPQTEVHVTGTAEPEYLAPKMFVEFVADISEKGQVKDKVDKLTICVATSDRPAGLSAPTSTDSKKTGGDKDADKKDAPAGGADAAAVFDAPAGGKKMASKVKHTAIEKLPGTFTVRGTVKSYKNHKLLVSTGHGPQIALEVSETAAIDVDIADLRNVGQGDKVNVKGQGMQNRVIADSISVELSNPLTGVKKKSSHYEKPAKTPAKADSKADAKTDGN